MQNFIGRQISHYHIIEQIGLGGMAVVYKAFDLNLQRDVALKLIRTDEIPASQHGRLMERFKREAQAQAKFDHPHIVPAYDYGEFEETPYLVLAFMPNGTLKDRMKGKMEVIEALSILTPIADAVAYAHRMGVLHRDIKPSNIIFSAGDIPMLTDFGIAKVLETTEATLTGTGLGVGTPEYMAPEQWQGRPCEASDQYALGVVLYEAITGQKPYTAETPLAVALKVLNEPLTQPRVLNPAIPEEVEKIIYQSLAREPQDRFNNMAAFHQQLKTLLDDLNERHKKSRTEVEIINIKLSLPIRQNAPISDQVTVDQIITAPVKVRKPKRQEKKNPHIETGKKGVPTRLFWIGLGIITVGFAIFLIALIPDMLLFNKRNPETQSVSEIQPTEEPTSISSLAPSGTATQTRTATIVPTATITPTMTLTLTPTLGIVDSRVREIDGMVQVFVPEGEFQVGWNSEQINAIYEACLESDYGYDARGSYDCSSILEWKGDPKQIQIGSFWIDQTEVTNGMYEECRLSGACPPTVKSSYTVQNYFWDPAYANYPMMNTYWDEANAYCEWVGARLPTYEEWQKAAFGTDGRLFPWGNTPPSTEILNYAGSNIGDSVPVGSYPEGKSPYGALDMFGNVSEWLGTCRQVELQNSVTVSACQFTGGDAISYYIDLYHTYEEGPWSLFYHGFRCVMDP